MNLAMRRELPVYLNAMTIRVPVATFTKCQLRESDHRCVDEDQYPCVDHVVPTGSAIRHDLYEINMELAFLGGAGTVTGSKYFIHADGTRLLVDCGLFQGFKQLRLRNWAPLPVNPGSVDTVILTHAHLDHSGYLPLLIKDGFSGPVISTKATCDLCAILLPDSGHLQEKDADFANRHGFSKHRPALPLYTVADAEAALKRFRPMPFDEVHSLEKGIEIRFRRAGHILGAAIVELFHAGITVVFSGDLGRPNDPTMVDPTPIAHADYLIIESTYGDRRHDVADPEEALADIINRTVRRGGTIVIPAFAVGRTQSILYYLQRLKSTGRIPDMPVFLDSPMAEDASDIFCKDFRDQKLTEQACRAACGVARYVRTVEQSKALTAEPVPKIIISASGMATGGRVLHHLKQYAPDPRNTILFTGFQAGGTRGAAMTSGAKTVKIHGAYVPIHAEVQNLHMLSAHADADEIMGWLRHFKSPPRQTFVTHGEPAAADALRHRIEEELGWPCSVAEYREVIPLI
jgi:metallo-beta-lactamase family protein